MLVPMPIHPAPFVSAIIHQYLSLSDFSNRRPLYALL
jgi:hypothetical protein